MKKIIIMLLAICLIAATLAVPAYAEATTPAAEEGTGHAVEMLEIIIVVSIVMWYIIDRFKPLWEAWAYGKYVTIAVSAVFAFALSFGYGLDIMAALGVVTAPSVLGTVLTALTLMGGSSAVSELIAHIKTD